MKNYFKDWSQSNGSAVHIFEKLDYDKIGEARFKEYLLYTVKGVNIGLRCMGNCYMTGENPVT